MVTDPVANLLVIIKNAQRAGHPSALVPHSKMNLAILELLKREGFVGDFEVRPKKDTRFKEVQVYLKYDSDGAPALTEIKRISKPGQRIYAPVGKIPKVHSGLGVAIVSTSAGILSDREARKRKVGGELLAFVA